jgi:hypothetical protein
MDKSFSWLAVTTDEPRQVLNALNLVDTGERAGPNKDGMLCARLANGTLLIRLDEFLHPIIDPESIASIPDASFVMVYSEFAEVETALACLYRQGVQLWHIDHCSGESVDHLAVMGAVPRTLKPMYQAARQRGQQYGYDAVFSVPAALAESVCGFNDKHTGAVYTRLALQSEYGGGNSARWQHLLRARSTELLPDDGFGRCRLFSSLLRPLLLEAGFSDAMKDNGLPFFTRKEAAYTIHVHIGASGKIYPRNGVVNVYVNHAEVQRHLEAVQLDDARRNTAELYVVRMLHGPFFPITTQAELADFVTLIERGLPDILERCTHIKGLDQLVNGDRVVYDMGYTDAQLVLAYLAGNPNYPVLLEQIDRRLQKSWKDPIGRYQRLDQYLREKVTPIHL